MQENARKIICQAHDYFINSGLTISAAESCTGGLICSYLTDIEGASLFLKGGIICYWTESKIEALGISPETIALHGAVSSETAIEMAERVRLLFGTDCSIATTGNLGPTTIEGKESGLVYIATSKKGLSKHKKLMLAGDRIENKVTTALAALEFITEGEFK